MRRGSWSSSSRLYLETRLLLRLRSRTNRASICCSGVMSYSPIRRSTNAFAFLGRAHRFLELCLPPLQTLGKCGRLGIVLCRRVAIVNLMLGTLLTGGCFKGIHISATLSMRQALGEGSQGTPCFCLAFRHGGEEQNEKGKKCGWTRDDDKMRFMCF